MLEAKGITVCYDSVKALENASFHVKQGEMVAMIGPNGAGKSSALNAVFGLVGLKAGEICLNGERVDQLRPDQRVAKGISLAPEGRRIFSTMTVLENLEIGCFNKKDIDHKKEAEKIFDLFPVLKRLRGLKAGGLSTGEQQILAMGRALIQKPTILLADEPSAGLSPSNIEIIFEKLIQIKEQGISVLIVEQNARMALEIVDRGYVFQVGSIVLEDTGKNLLNNEKIIKLYFGGN